MQEEAPMFPLLPVEFDAELEVLDGSALLGFNGNRVSDEIVDPLPGGERCTHR